MATERLPSPAVLIMGVLSGSAEFLSEAEARVQSVFGPVIRRTPPVSFQKFTSYYEAEMGPGLLRSYWVFEERLERGALVEAKLATNRIERELSEGGRRTVNLDPGLLAAESVVLATSKAYSHRIYLSKGIYGELAFMFRKDGGIDHMPWTYPDYREPEVTDFIKVVRREMILS